MPASTSCAAGAAASARSCESWDLTGRHRIGHQHGGLKPPKPYISSWRARAGPVMFTRPRATFKGISVLSVSLCYYAYRLALHDRSWIRCPVGGCESIELPFMGCDATWLPCERCIGNMVCAGSYGSIPGAYAGRSVENVSILVRKRVLKKSALENYLYQRYVQGLVRCVGATHKRGRVWTSRKVFIAEDELNQKAYIPLRYTRECARREGGLRRWRIMISAHGACTHEF